MKKLIILLITSAMLISLCISAQENTVKNETAINGSGCTVTNKNYKSEEYHSKISGTWKAAEVWIHETNLLGERNFYFTFLPNDSIKIDEPESNWHSKGKWSLDLTENAIQWEMPDANNSFEGKYDIIDGRLILSGKGFVGADEFVCLKLKKL